MKLQLSKKYLWFGLFLVFTSIIFEIFRTPINFYKGLYSINIGLFFIFFSLKDNLKWYLKKENLFFINLLLIYIFGSFITNSIHLILNINSFITIVLTITILFHYILLFFKK